MGPGWDFLFCPAVLEFAVAVLDELAGAVLVGFAEAVPFTAVVLDVACDALAFFCAPPLAVALSLFGSSSVVRGQLARKWFSDPHCMQRFSLLHMFRRVSVTGFAEAVPDGFAEAVPVPAAAGLRP